MQDLNNNQMPPGSNKNLIIFMVISAVLYFAYDTYVLKPHETALRQARFEANKERLLQQPDTASTPALQTQTSATQLQTAQDAVASQKNITINNDHIHGALSLTGAQLNYWQLKDYDKTMDDADPVEILSPKNTAFPRGIEYGWVSSDASVALPTNKTQWNVKGSNTTLTPTSPVTLQWDNGNGLRFERLLTLDNDYLITVTQSVVNTTTDNVTLHPYGLISQRGLPAGFEKRMISHEGPIGYIGGELHDPKYKDLHKKKTMGFDASSGWLGMTDKYWLTALMPPQGQNVKYRFIHSGAVPDKKEKDNSRYQADFTGSALFLSPGQSGSITSHVFAGPKRVLLLKEYSKQLGVDKLDLSVDFGMFWFFTIPFFYGLHYLGGLLGNMGLAIIALTLIVRTAASPLTYSSYKSFAKMKKVMPQVNELKEKYGEDDKQKLQQEMMALYQREGVNPMAGCVPILLQIPIFFAFYKILFVTIEIRHAPFYGWIQDLSAADPTNLFNLFGLLPFDPPSILHVGIWPCLMLVAMQIQRKLNPPPVDKIQRDMMRLFPIMMTFVMANFASGLVIYWTISAFFGNVQQIIIMRKMGVPIHLFGESDDTHDDKKGAAANTDKSDDLPVIDVKPEVIKNITPPKPKKKKKK